MNWYPLVELNHPLSGYRPDFLPLEEAGINWSGVTELNGSPEGNRFTVCVRNLALSRRMVPRGWIEQPLPPYQRGFLPLKERGEMAGGDGIEPSTLRCLRLSRPFREPTRAPPFPRIQQLARHHPVAEPAQRARWRRAENSNPSPVGPIPLRTGGGAPVHFTLHVGG